MNTLDRRRFLASSAALAALGLAPPAARAAGGEQPRRGDTYRGPCSIASANGLKAVARAMELVREGYDPADCVVQGVRIVEDDPEDDTVGYGGLPNEEGVVELDACVMHGPTHKSGAVAALRNIRNPAMVALEVLRRTDHCLIVGEGALKFARRMGFVEENLLTERARLEWLKWRSELSPHDDWLDADQRDEPVGKTFTPEVQAAIDRRREWRAHYGTIHCSIVTPKQDVASCTTTSGLSWKIPGRVGDSPIIGAGNYCENDVGAAGCTGRGEAAIVTCAAFSTVQHMARGMTPTEAALAVARRVAELTTREKRNRDGQGRPRFDMKIYALRKDGAHGAASLFSGAQYAVCEQDGEARLEPAAFVFEGRPEV
jgi:N4-(beta-N-acetylglucosaminyl)-L-asparaginase